MRIDVLHGPNLNLLGTREPAIYGSTTLNEINERLVKQGALTGLEVRCSQHNGEGGFVDAIQAAAAAECAGFVVNAAAYTHTSVAIRDALVASGVPFVEVHLSNVHTREAFRHTSLLADVAIGVVCGFGALGYEFALAGLLERVRAQ
jgi:3-dehydroquinate dehydratase-2